MSNLLQESAFFGAVITLAAFEIGQLLKKKLKISVFNPILIATALVIASLALIDMDYGTCLLYTSRCV